MEEGKRRGERERERKRRGEREREEGREREREKESAREEEESAGRDGQTRTQHRKDKLSHRTSTRNE